MLNATVFHMPVNNDDAMLVLRVCNNYGGLEIAPTVIISDADTSGAATWKDQCRVIKTHGMPDARARELRWNILRQMIGAPPWGDNVTGNIPVPGNPLKNLWAAADWKARKSFAARRLEKRLRKAGRLFPVPNEAFSWLLQSAQYAEDAYLRAIALGVKLGITKTTLQEREHNYWKSLGAEARNQIPSFSGEAGPGVIQYAEDGGDRQFTGKSGWVTLKQPRR